MRIGYRIYGAMIFMFLMIFGFAVIIMQENWKEMWVALAFFGAFSVGMVIYIKSNWAERNRLQAKKEKDNERKNKNKKSREDRKK